MEKCTKCSALIEEGEMCSSCKAELKNNDVTNTIPKTVKKLHCPNCKSFNIVITTESSVSGAISSSTGGLTATSVSNTHRNYWFCQDCGSKFRNIQNLEEEIEKKKKDPLIIKIISIIFAIISIQLFITSSNGLAFLIMPYAIATMVVPISGFFYIRYLKKQRKKMKAELEVLKINCFD